ncbi:extracellular solute-binding protein [Caldibacillus lycopersici]|uniref:Extracellular solute-binding protein n=1 Tax=Perspicuibacillus lycopersici TaxID=1325689 RepID=A0AAE3ISI8_9BACI|nr:extracellular solute-binding protein [Perspicuibacillus lycopersici]MCU9612634.1 extracellular solute-binding protein [Perspicuibacillus lycopersici]
MKKKFLSLIGILGLSAALVGCNGDDQAAGDGEKDKDPEANAPEAVEELPEKDFGGMTLTWAAPWLREIDPNASEIMEKWNDRIEMLEEKWNFTFESKEIGWDDYVGNYIRTTLAGDPVGDIVYLLTPNFYPNLVDNGIVYPVSDVGVIDYNDPKWVKSATEASKYKGKTYSLKAGTASTISTRDGIFWNKTLFDELGLPNLYELYENGEWTWDKLVEVAEMATKDTNNDGETDIYGFASENLPWKLIYSNGYESIIKNDDGIDINMNDDRVIEALEFYQDFSQNKSNVLRDWFEGANWDFRYTEFANGTIGMVSGEWWIAGSYLTEGRMQDEYGFLPFPSGPSNDTPISYGYEESLEVMLATVENPEDKVFIWDAINDIGTEEDWSRWLREEYEGTAGDEESVEYAMMLNDNTKINLIRGFENINTIFNDFFSQIASGATTVQSGLEAIDPQIQAELEDFKNNGVDLGIEEESAE